MTGYPCCCDSATGVTPCAQCATDETPAAIAIDISGFTNDDCLNASDFTITESISQTSGCTFSENIGSPLGGIGDGVVSCSSAVTDISVAIVFEATKITVTITNADTADSGNNNVYLFEKTGLTAPYDCCDEINPALTIPFVSQTPSGSGITMGHDGSGATVTLQCLYCQHCIDVPPEEMQLVIGTGSTSAGNCTDGNCDFKSGTYVAPQIGLCSWEKTFEDVAYNDANGGACALGDMKVRFSIITAGGNVKVRATIIIWTDGFNSDATTWEWDSGDTIPIDCSAISFTDTTPSTFNNIACDDTNVSGTVTAV